MKVWLDDWREAREGWIHVRTVNEAILLLEGGSVTEISLDNDLGEYDDRQGKEVMNWIEQELAIKCRMPPEKIYIHTANPDAERYMYVVLKRINKMVEALRVQRRDVGEYEHVSRDEHHVAVGKLKPLDPNFTPSHELADTQRDIEGIKEKL